MRANRHGDKITQATIAQQEGPFLLTGFKLTDAVKGVGFIARRINRAWMAWSSVPLPGWVRWAGIGVSDSSHQTGFVNRPFSTQLTFAAFKCSFGTLSARGLLPPELSTTLQFSWRTYPKVCRRPANPLS